MKSIKKNKLLFTVVMIYVLLWVFKMDKAVLSVKNSSYYVIEMLQIMPVIFVLTSLIEAWVPREVIINGLGEKSGLKGTFISFILGSVSAGPIYAAFPVCKMLLKKGANISNIVIILSTWAVTKVPMLVNEGKFLGNKFMALRWVLTTISIFIMAYLMSKVVHKESIPLERENNNRDMVEISSQYCIGCGLCIKISPDIVKMDSGKAVFINPEITQDMMINIREMIHKCPAKAIHLN